MAAPLRGLGGVRYAWAAVQPFFNFVFIPGDRMTRAKLDSLRKFPLGFKPIYAATGKLGFKLNCGEF